MIVYVVQYRDDGHIIAVYANEADAKAHVANHTSFGLDDVEYSMYEVAA